MCIALSLDGKTNCMYVVVYFYDCIYMLFVLLNVCS
jgi:hypothetical protein